MRGMEVPMALRLLFLVALILMLQSCADDAFSRTAPRPPPPPGATLLTPARPPGSIKECAPDKNEWTQITSLYEATEWSIHELITCGRVQVNLSKSLLAIVLASNRDLFRGDAFETLSDYARFVGLDLTAPFSRAEEGRWSMPIEGASPGSRFWVQFFRPDSDEPILEDPFDLESYLVNARIETLFTLDEMLADLSLRNDFIFFFDEEGPLSSLFNDGEPLPNPFIVTASIADIANLVLPGFRDDEEDDDGPFFGPLTSVTDAEMISCVEFFDDRGSAHIEYRADGRRDTVGRIAGSGQVGFDLDSIMATDDKFQLIGEASTLEYLGVKSLAGEIRYEVVGVDGLVIESDFRSGNPWPITNFMCVDGR